jgi:hypothetical protein
MLRLRLILLVAACAGAAALRVYLEDEEQVERSTSVNSLFADRHSYETQTEPELSNGVITGRITYRVKVDAPLAASPGPVREGLPLCELDAPSGLKDFLAKGVTAVTATLAVDAVTPPLWREWQDVYGPVVHVVAEHVGGNLAWKFPQQRVATCLRLPVLNYWAWSRYRAVEVRAKVRGSGGNLHVCNPNHTDQCGVPRALWLDVPSVDELNRMIEFTRESSEKRRYFDMSGIDLLFSPIFVNGSDDSLEGQLEIVFEPTKS